MQGGGGGVAGIGHTVTIVIVLWYVKKKNQYKSV